MLKIGSYDLNTNTLLAPMAGVTDLSFRLIAREHGAKFCFFEMIDAHSVIRHRRKMLKMLKSVEADRPVAFQILANDSTTALQAARTILPLADARFLDINAACPVRKVIKKHSGAFLLKDGDVLCEMIKILASSLPIPVTVKIRAGYDDEPRTHIARLAARCESSGASAIFIHGRTRPQLYSGAVDYDAIKAVKDSVKIPVIGSGDVFSPQSAKKMLDVTGCDAVLVARGALGNPWIFKAIEGYLDNGSLPEPRDLSIIKDTAKRHLSYMQYHMECGDPGKVGVMRKVLTWYMRSFPNARAIRGEINLVKEYEKMIELIDSIEASVMA